MYGPDPRKYGGWSPKSMSSHRCCCPLPHHHVDGNGRLDTSYPPLRAWDCRHPRSQNDSIGVRCSKFSCPPARPQDVSDFLVLQPHETSCDLESLGCLSILYTLVP